MHSGFYCRCVHERFCRISNFSSCRTEKVVDGIFVNKDTMLFFAAVAVPGIFILKGIADYTRSYLLSYIGQNVIRDLRMELLKN